MRLTTTSLTARQKDVLTFFEKRAREGLPPPTYGEVARHFRWKSLTAAKRHILELVRKGALRSEGLGARRGVTLASYRVNATVLVDRLDQAPVIDLAVPSYLMPEEGVLFAFHAHGNGMAEFGILENDLVLVGPRKAAARPRLLVGSVHGLPEVLHPRHPRLHGKVHGVVVAVMRSLSAAADSE